MTLVYVCASKRYSVIVLKIWGRQSFVLKNIKRRKHPLSQRIALFRNNFRGFIEFHLECAILFRVILFMQCVIQFK